MNKKQAYHVLRMEGLDVDTNHLSRDDEDTFIYLDWKDWIQWTVTDAGKDGIIISKLSFQEASSNIDLDLPGMKELLQGEEFYKVADVCPDCLQPLDLCVCIGCDDSYYH